MLCTARYRCHNKKRVTVATQLSNQLCRFYFLFVNAFDKSQYSLLCGLFDGFGASNLILLAMKRWFNSSNFSKWQASYRFWRGILINYGQRFNERRSVIFDNSNEWMHVLHPQRNAHIPCHQTFFQHQNRNDERYNSDNLCHTRGNEWKINIENILLP